MDKLKATMLLTEIKVYLTAGNPVWDVDEIAEALDMAIEALRNEINCVKCVHYTERETHTGIKGVCKMDTAHREDLIRRDDALKPFCIAPDGTRIPEVDCDNLPVEFSVEFIKKHLLSLPSAEPNTKCIAQIKIDRDDIEDFINEKVNEIEVNMEEPKTGKWVKDALGMTVCSECRRWRRDNRKSHINFCNSCGARMIGEEE